MTTASQFKAADYTADLMSVVFIKPISVHLLAAPGTFKLL